MEFLSNEDIIKNGREFKGDVCYSGEYGQQVYTKDMEEGGTPIEGILYEKYPNGSLNYYCYYRNGIPHGQKVRYYESGKVKSFCIMDTGTVDGEDIEFYESGDIKKKKYYQYGLVLKMQEFDEAGNLINEKKDLKENEKIIYAKREEFSKRQINGK